MKGQAGCQRPLILQLTTKQSFLQPKENDISRWISFPTPREERNSGFYISQSPSALKALGIRKTYRRQSCKCVWDKSHFNDSRPPTKFATTNHTEMRATHANLSDQKDILFSNWPREVQASEIMRL